MCRSVVWKWRLSELPMLKNGEGTKSGKSQIYLMASFTSAHYGNLCCKWPYSPQPPPPTHMPSPHPISSWIHQGLSLWADFQCTCVSWWHYFGLEYESEVLRICLQATCCFWIIKELPNKSLNCIMILFWSRKHCSTSWFCVGVFVTDLGGNGQGCMQDFKKGADSFYKFKQKYIKQLHLWVNPY